MLSRERSVLPFVDHQDDEDSEWEEELGFDEDDDEEYEFDDDDYEDEYAEYEEEFADDEDEPRRGRRPAEWE